MKLVVALLAMASSLVTFAPVAHADAGDPVILVSGWQRGNTTAPPDMFDAMRAALEADGRDVYVAALPGDSNVRNAEVIARLVDEIGADHDGKVDIVAHSMGGLSARHYIKFLGGDRRVGHYVSMGTGQYGWLPTCQQPEDDGGDMCPTKPFMMNLNRGDDTPGDVSYTTLRTMADDRMLFGSTVDLPLDGGVCAKYQIDGGPHLGEPSNPVMIGLVREALSGRCPGVQLDLPILY